MCLYPQIPKLTPFFCCQVPDSSQNLGQNTEDAPIYLRYWHFIGLHSISREIAVV